MVSKGWVKRLFKEIEGWLNEKIIDGNQAEKIKEKYAQALEYNRLVTALFSLGAVLVGLGIILFIASNWQKIGRPIKVGLIFSFISLFNLEGYYLRFKNKNYPKLGETLLFIGAVSFGAGIWLVAQIFNIHANYANGVLFWIIGIIPTIILLRSKTTLVLASLLTPVWLGTYMVNNPKSYIFSLFLLLAIILFFVYREKQVVGLFFSIVTVGIWLGHFLYLLAKDMHFNYLQLSLLYNNIFIAYGFVLYSLGTIHSRINKIRDFSNIYKLTGLTIVLAGNYVLTFAHHYSLGIYQTTATPLDTYLISLIIYSLFIFSAAVFVWNIVKPIENRMVNEGKLMLVLLALQVIFMNFGPLGDRGISISYNLLLFSEIVAFLYFGYLLRSEHIFRLSLYAFGLDVITRYFDTFWKILPRSLFFIVGGVILLVGGIFMERKRKAVERKIREELAGRENV